MNINDERNKELAAKEIKNNIMLYPDERVVAFIANNYKGENNINKNALDIGFGSGRNLIPLLDYGFNCYGIDYSKECCETAERSLGNRENLKELKVEDLLTTSFSSEFFDVILMYGVAFLRRRDEIEKDIRKGYSLLKNGGKMIINFRTKEDYLYGKGKKVCNETYIVDEEPYNGLLYTFFNKDEAEEMLKSIGFKINNCEKYEYWKDNLCKKNRWWIFSVEK